MKLLGMWAFFVTLFLISSPAWSSPLSKDEVERFMASMQELQAMESWFEAFDKATGQEVKQWDMPVSPLISDMVAIMRGHKAHDILNRAAREHGFTDAEAWSRTGDRVMLAVMSLQMGGMAPAIKAEMARLITELENNPHFSAEQKTRMRNMISRSTGVVSRVAEVPDADKKAVRPHLETLKRVLKYDSE